MSPSAHPQSSPAVQTGWEPTSAAPFDRDLELAVIEDDRIHALVFPCRRVLGGWMNAQTMEVITRFAPSHWREWRRN